MLDGRLFVLFLAAATLLAITPGPGIFYVLSRSLTGGRKEGFLSAAGTFAGGLVHVVAAAIGISAIIAASALAFAVVKYAGAAYLIFLGVGMIRSRNTPIEEGFGHVPKTCGWPLPYTRIGKRAFQPSPVYPFTHTIWRNV